MTTSENLNLKTGFLQIEKDESANMRTVGDMTVFQTIDSDFLTFNTKYFNSVYTYETQSKNTKLVFGEINSHLYPLSEEPDKSIVQNPTVKTLTFKPKLKVGTDVIYTNGGTTKYGKITELLNQNRVKIKGNSKPISASTVVVSNRNKNVNLTDIIEFTSNNKTLIYDPHKLSDQFLQGSKNDSDYKKYIRGIHLQNYFQKTKIITGLQLEKNSEDFRNKLQSYSQYVLNVKANDDNTIRRDIEAIFKKNETIETVIIGIKISHEFTFDGFMILGTNKNISEVGTCLAIDNVLNKMRLKAGLRTNKKSTLTEKLDGKMCPTYYKEATSMIVPIPSCCVRKDIKNIKNSYNGKNTSWIENMDVEVQQVVSTMNESAARATFLQEWRELRKELLVKTTEQQQEVKNTENNILSTLNPELIPTFKSLSRQIRLSLESEFLAMFHMKQLYDSFRTAFPAQKNPPFVLYYYLPGKNNVNAKSKPRVYIEHRIDQKIKTNNNKPDEVSQLSSKVIELKEGEEFEYTQGAIFLKIPDYKVGSNINNKLVNPNITSNKGNKTKLYPITAFPTAFPVADFKTRVYDVRYMIETVLGSTVMSMVMSILSGTLEKEESEEKRAQAITEATKILMKEDGLEYNEGSPDLQKYRSQATEMIDAGLKNQSIATTGAGIVGMLSRGAKTVWSWGGQAVTAAGSLVGATGATASAAAATAAGVGVVAVGGYLLYQRFKKKNSSKSGNNNSRPETAIVANVNGKLIVKRIKEGTLESIFSMATGAAISLLTFGGAIKTTLSKFTKKTLQNLVSITKYIDNNPVFGKLGMSMAHYIMKRICMRFKQRFNIGNNVKFNPNTMDSQLNSLIATMLPKIQIEELLYSAANATTLQKGLEAAAGGGSVANMAKGAVAGTMISKGVYNIFSSMWKLSTALIQKNKELILIAVAKGVDNWLKYSQAGKSYRIIRGLVKTCYEVPKPVATNIKISVEKNGTLLGIKSMIDFRNGQVTINHAPNNLQKNSAEVKKVIKDHKGTLNKILEHKLYHISNKEFNKEINLELNDGFLTLPLSMTVGNTKMKLNTILNSQFFDALKLNNPQVQKLLSHGVLDKSLTNMNAKPHQVYHAKKAFSNSVYYLKKRNIQFRNTNNLGFSIDKNNNIVYLPKTHNFMNVSILLRSRENAKNNAQTSQFQSIVIPIYRNTSPEDLLNTIRIPNMIDQVYDTLSKKHLSTITYKILEDRISLAKDTNVNIVPQMALNITYDTKTVTKNTNQMKYGGIGVITAGVVGALSVAAFGISSTVALPATIFLALGSGTVYAYKYVTSPKYVYSISNKATSKTTEHSYIDSEEKMGGVNTKDSLIIEYVDKKLLNTPVITRDYIIRSSLTNEYTIAQNNANTKNIKNKTLQNVRNKSTTISRQMLYHVLKNPRRKHFYSYSLEIDNKTIPNLPVEQHHIKLYGLDFKRLLYAEKVIKFVTYDFLSSQEKFDKYFEYIISPIPIKKAEQNIIDGLSKLRKDILKYMICINDNEEPTELMSFFDAQSFINKNKPNSLLFLGPNDNQLGIYIKGLLTSWTMGKTI